MKSQAKSEQTSEPQSWLLSEGRRRAATITRYREWLEAERGLAFEDYEELWGWSTDDLEGFWGSIAEFFGIGFHRDPERVVGKRTMPGAEWFPGAKLNFAEAALRGDPGQQVLLGADEDGNSQILTRGELRAEVARVAAGLRRLGVGRGDRVAALVTNGTEAVIAFLASAGIGATWTTCSPDFGTTAVTKRFSQIRPKVLFAVDGYRFGGVEHDRRSALEQVRAALPDLEATVLVPRLAGAEAVPDAIAWADLGAGRAGEPEFEALPFDHPLWILYSSGTTGIPKAIVHSHGGILLEQVKSHALHLDLGPDDRLMWFTTTAWAAWNLLISGLLLGGSVVAYEGSLRHPTLGRLWQTASDLEVTTFAASPGFLEQCAKAGMRPAEEFDLSSMRTLVSSGALLLPATHRWIYENVGEELFVANISGGTDMCTPIIGALPTLPNYAGELQCRMLGSKVEAFDEDGKPVIGRLGELVITEPIPSMPLFLWGDEDGSRYQDTWFDRYPGIWRHGDWIEITERGTCILHGRSDATLNRGGVRMGSTDFYAIVEELDRVEDSLVIDLPDGEGGTRIVMFVVPVAGVDFDADLESEICTALREQGSPRHVPDQIHAVQEIPRTRTGKKMEVPVKRILSGHAAEDVLSRDALLNPGAIEWFVEAGRAGGLR